MTTMAGAPPTADFTTVRDDLVAHINGLQPAIRDLTVGGPTPVGASREAAAAAARRAVELLWRARGELDLAATLASRD